MAFSSHERLLMIAALLCVCAFAADRFVLEPLTALWKERSARIAQLDQWLQKGHMLAEREDSLRKQWERMQAAGLPDESAQAEKAVLNELSRWVKDSGIQMTSQKPSWTQDEEEENKKLELSLTATGNIESAARFLYAADTSPLAVKTEDFNLSAQDEKGRQLALSFRLSGLVLLKEEQ